ncbi:MAG TPA: hypothetical protein VNJ29_01040 [Candidatus Nitrosotenuis sp.]|nr:hypothetical protein [Candidatus Nitrosotenuis sp.]
MKPNSESIKEYSHFLQDLNLKTLRIGCILAFTLVPLSGVLDYLTNPEFFKTFLYIRLVSSMVSLLIYLTSFSHFGKHNSVILGIALTSNVAIAISVMIRFLGYESPYYAGLNLIILAIGVLFPWGPKETFIASSLILSYYLVPTLIFDKVTNYKILFSNSLFILETIIIAVASSFFTSRLRLQEFQAKYELNNTKNSLEVSYQKLQELDQIK